MSSDPHTARGTAAAVTATTSGSGGTSAASQSTDHVLHRADLAVRWRDLDAFNHVNNSSYLTYLEEARLQWFDTLPDAWMSDAAAPVLAASHLNYRQPIGWPESLSVELAVERLGATSLTLAHRIVSARDSSRVYCDGNVVLVWIDRASGRSTALPEAVRAACAATG